jgi:hypothetical protein
VAGTTVLVGGNEYMRLGGSCRFSYVREIGIRWLIDVEFPFSETCTESPLLCLSCSLRAVPRLQGAGDDSRGMKLRSSAV